MTKLIEIKERTFVDFDYPEVSFINQMMSILGVKVYFIAGGYLRDKENGVPFKDVDVFIPGHLGIPMDATSDEVQYDLSNAMEVTIDGEVINLIKLEHKHTLESVLSRMDIGICQIGMKPDGTIVATQAYLDDVANRTLTVFKAMGSDHFNRVRAKYPDHRVLARN